ncbi:hypothetical protein J7L67_06130, partial [bacterium]|nr:hypothetical protein [bacterium]
FKISDFSTDEEFSYSLKTAYLNDTPNIFSNGFLKIDLPNKELSLRDTDFSTRMSSFSIEKLKKSFSHLKADDLPDELEGSVHAVIKQLKLNNNGLVTLKAEGKVAGGKIVASKKIKSPIENIEAKWDMNESDFNFTKLSLQIGSGQITGSAKIKNYSAQPQFNALLNINALDFNDLIINQTNEENVKIEGKLNGYLNLTAEGTVKEKILESIEGACDLSITDGKLSDINILKIVLGKLTMFPGLPEIIETGLPDKYKKKLAEEDTVLTKAEIKADIKNKQIYLAPITVLADNFDFRGRGEADFDKKFVLKGAFYVPPSFSLRLVKRLNELKYILDDQNRLFIPLQVHGTGADLKFIVDIKYLGKKVIRTQGRDELKKLIYKSLKKKTDKQEEQTEPQQDNQAENQSGEQQTKPEEKSIEEIIIDNVLDKFFKLDEY